MQIFLTALVTVIGGALTLALGQILVRGVIEPALKLKRLIGAIAFDIDYYANKFPPVGSPPPDSPTAQEWRDIFRKHSCSLCEKLNLVVWYRPFRFLFRLPPRDDVAKAAGELMGHSNRPIKATDPALAGRDTEIKRLLAIEDLGAPMQRKRRGWFRLGVVLSVFWVALSVLLYFAGIVLYPSPLTNWLSRLYAWVERTPVMERGIEFTPLYPTPQPWGLLLFTGLPLFLGWLFFFVIPRSIRWIQDGFRE